MVREQLINPTMIVKSENKYSIVAKPKFHSNERPFFRYEKHKDETGFYIIYQGKYKIYESNWIRK